MQGRSGLDSEAPIFGRVNKVRVQDTLNRLVGSFVCYYRTKQFGVFGPFSTVHPIGIVSQLSLVGT